MVEEYSVLKEHSFLLLDTVTSVSGDLRDVLFSLLVFISYLCLCYLFNQLQLSKRQFY